jgi:hypothetical protein
MGKDGLGAHEELANGNSSLVVASYFVVSPQVIKSNHLHPSMNRSIKTTELELEGGMREREEKKD